MQLEQNMRLENTVVCMQRREGEATEREATTTEPKATTEEATEREATGSNDDRAGSNGKQRRRSRKRRHRKQFYRVRLGPQRASSVWGKKKPRAAPKNFKQQSGKQREATTTKPKAT